MLSHLYNQKNADAEQEQLRSVLKYFDGEWTDRQTIFASGADLLLVNILTIHCSQQLLVLFLVVEAKPNQLDDGEPKIENNVDGQCPIIGAVATIIGIPVKQQLQEQNKVEVSQEEIKWVDCQNVHYYIMKHEKGKVLMYVIEEDEHLKNLEKIIKRDFFPALKNLQDPDEEVPNVTLGTYVANFKSDENENFSKIVQDDDKMWKEKHWWMQHGLSKEETKQKMLTGQYQNMIEGNRDNALAITNAEPTNDLMFHSGSQLRNESMDKYDEMKKVVFQNTRLPETDKALVYQATVKNNQDYVLDTKLADTPLLLGIDDQQDQKYTLEGQFKEPKPRKKKLTEVNGYPIVMMPSPSPNVMPSPLMTYGDIEGTPVREYRMPQTPQRQIILEKLNQKIVSSKREEQSRKEQTFIRIRGSNTPTPLKSLLKSRLGSSVRKAPSTVREKNDKN